MSTETKPSLREWIRQQADEQDVPVEELLLQSQRRDPMWKGTSADHAKAEWFARYWELTVEGRKEQQVHPRGVHYTVYQLDRDVEPPTRCSWDVYRNTEQCYDYLEDASVLARVLGYVPLDGVTDNKHDQTVVTEYGEHQLRPTPADVSIVEPTGVSVPTIPRVEERARFRFDGDADTSPDRVDYAEYAGARLARELEQYLVVDGARQAGLHIELWCEKSLPGEAKDVARRHGVNVVVEGEGDLSYTVAADLATRIQDADKPAAILYCSDFDPKGDNMATAMAGKLAWLKQRGDLDQRTVVKQLAVTPQQIRVYDLPRKPISGSDVSATGTGGRAYDTLVSEWEQRKGTGAVELQALWKDHDVFLDILRDGLEAVVDEDLPAKTRQARSVWRDEVREAVREAVDESDAGEHLADLDEWIERFNDELEDAHEEIEQLRALIDDGAYAEWRDAVQALVDEVDVPALDVPEGEVDLPDNPLYDTERSYAENLRIVRAHKEGSR